MLFQGRPSVRQHIFRATARVGWLSTTDQTPAPATKAETLDKVVVTGSLIPQTSLETAKPVLVISAEDLKTRGYTNVQDALHQSSFATGGVQGNQTSASFTQGAVTNSLFGLNPGYTKYLIDGRPMANASSLPARFRR